MAETKKRGPGRPKGATAETKANPVNNWFRSTKAQSARWKRTAKKANLPYRTWIKIVLDRAVGVELAPDAIEDPS